MTTITACIVAYNDHELLNRCIASVRGVVDEIIIIHDGTPNKETYEAMTIATDRVYIGKHLGDAAPHRPDFIDLARRQWLLILDTDEYLSQELKQNIRALIQTKTIDAYEFKTTVWYNNKLITSKPFNNYHRLSLYRKNKIIKEKLLPNGTLKTSGIIKTTNYVIHHQKPGQTSKQYNANIIRLAELEASNTTRTRGKIYYEFKALISPITHFIVISRKGIFNPVAISLAWNLSLYYYYFNKKLARLT